MFWKRFGIAWACSFGVMTFGLFGQNPASRNGYHLLSALPLAEHVEFIKSSDLIFFIQPDEIPYMSCYEQMFQLHWHISPFQVISDYHHLDSLWHDQTGKHCFMSITSATTNSQLDPTLVTQFPYLSIWYPKNRKDGSVDRTKINGVIRFPLLLDRNQLDIRSLISSVYQKGHLLQPNSDVHYEKEIYYNWHPGYIGLYLRMAERIIHDKIMVAPYGPVEYDNSKAGILGEMTLHIPEYALEHLSVFSLEPRQPLSSSNLFQDYEGVIKIANAEELYQLLTVSYTMEDCFLYAQWNALTVIHISTGEILYHQRHPSRLKPQLRATDIRNLINSMKTDNPV